MVWGEGEGEALGYLGADFDLRDLPVTSKLYEEPGAWRQVKGDPAIRGALFQQSRIESPMDRNLDRALSDPGGVADRTWRLPMPDPFLQQPGHHLDPE